MLPQTPGMLAIASGGFSQRSGLTNDEIFGRYIQWKSLNLNSSASSPQMCFALLIARIGTRITSFFATLPNTHGNSMSQAQITGHVFNDSLDSIVYDAVLVSVRRVQRHQIWLGRIAN